MALTPVMAVFVYGGALMVVALVAGFFVLRARRRAMEKAKAARPGFAIEELEALLAAGQISDDEFKKLRRTALGVAPAGGQGKGPMTPQALAGAADDRMHRPDPAVEKLDQLAAPQADQPKADASPDDEARQDTQGPEATDPPPAYPSSGPPEHDDEKDIPA